MIAAMAAHVAYDVLRLGEQPTLPSDWLSASTFLVASLAITVAILARPRSAGDLGAFRPEPVLIGATVALCFIALSTIAFPPRDLFLAADGGWATVAIWTAVVWARRGRNPLGSEERQGIALDPPSGHPASDPRSRESSPERSTG